MGKLPQRFPSRSTLAAFLTGLACFFVPALPAQITYTATPGKTSIYVNYDPNAPAPKAPEAPPATKEFLPVGTMEQYLAQKAEMAQFSLLSFPSASQVETTYTPGPRAPGASGPQVAATAAPSWQALPNTGFQPPSP